jgi:iron complex outermembrane receptor protein
MRFAISVAVLAALASPAYSQNEDSVVVTATRFPRTDPNIPANVSVITREDIRRLPAVSLADVFKSQTGLEMRPLYGPLGIDATLDMRGFGDAAGANTLILLDGQRLNPVSSDGINWNSIPLESIQRIEIIRGSGTVLYGDRASGGVVNIITDKSGKPRASAAVSLGGFGYRSADASIAGGADPAGGLYYSLTGHYADTKGYRQNSQQDELSVAGRFGLRTGFGEGFVDYGAHKSSNGLPGALFQAQFDNDPRFTRQPGFLQNRSGHLVRPGIVAELGRDVTLEAELGYDKGDTSFRSPTFNLDRETETLSLTPRLRWRHNLGSHASETVFGLDLYRGDIVGDSFSTFSGTNRQTAQQNSTAFYLQNITSLAAPLHATLGLRRQRMQQEATDEGAALRGEATRALTAYEIGLSFDVAPGARVHGKIGKTFRFPNTDELFGFDPVTFAPLFRGDLKPQHGPIREIGASLRRGTFQLQASLYQLDLKDEINFNNVSGNNENFPATRRRGLELEGRWQMTPDLQGRLGLARTEAKFSEGPFSGMRVPMAPDSKAFATLDWNAGAYGRYGVSVNHVGKRYYSGDLANAREKLSGYTTVDLQVVWDLRPWTVSAKLMNAFDRKYAPFAGIDFLGRLFYFPADPRTFYVSAAYIFR